MARMRWLTAVALFALACGGGPTAPDPRDEELFIFSFVMGTNSSTIRVVRMTLDGREVAVFNDPEGARSVRFHNETARATRGEHVLRLIVVDQTTSPNPYVLFGSILVLHDVIHILTDDKVLATGESIDYRFVY